MHWVLQNNLFNEDAYQELLDFLVANQISHSVHRVIPFIGDLSPLLDLETKNCHLHGFLFTAAFI